MKIGFSSLVCPGWDLETIVSKASEFGFDGVELRGIKGELNLTEVASLRVNPAAVRQMFAMAKVELVSLACGCTLDARKPADMSRSRDELAQHIELASRLGCPYVRMFAGDVQRGETRGATISRVAEELTRMAKLAAERSVTILITNAGDFAGSEDLWYLCDCASHPAIRVCWNPCTAMTRLERPTISIPRLGNKIGMLHVCDALFDESGFMDGYAIPGEGNVELRRMVELLKGVFYQDYLTFEWPKLFDASLPSADVALPKVAAFLKECIAAEQPKLTAYKGKDHRVPTFEAMPEQASSRPRERLFTTPGPINPVVTDRIALGVRGVIPRQPRVH